MLISTKILRKHSSKTTVVRDWRVVQVPEEDAAVTSISTLFKRLCDHVYDPMEPFQPTQTDKEAPVRAEIGSSQKGSDFQSIPLSVMLGDAVNLFGLYIKLYILVEEEENMDASAVPLEKNALEVCFCCFLYSETCIHLERLSLGGLNFMCCVCTCRY